MANWILWFWPQWLAAITAAATLSLGGSLLSEKQSSLQCFAMSNGSIFGILLGAALGLSSGGGTAALAIGGALALHFFGHWSQGSKPTELTWIVLLVMSTVGTSVLVHFFPSIERHRAASWMGDLATVSVPSGLAIAGTGLVILASSFWWWDRSAKALFEQVVLRNTYMPQTSMGSSSVLKHFSTRGFGTTLDWTLAVGISLSVWQLGLLFTLGCLFIPSWILGKSASHGLVQYRRTLVAVAALGSVLAFPLGFYAAEIPTVPLVLSGILAAGCLLRVVRKLATR